MKRLFTGSLIVLISLVSGCGKKHPREAYEALASLRKVQAATQVGVNYQTYSQLLIEAKDKTNAASRVLSDGPLKVEIGATMDACGDAGQLWGVKITPGYLRSDDELGRKLISKYSLKRLPSLSKEGPEFIDEDEGMQVIWLNADSHLSKLAELLPENQR